MTIERKAYICEFCNTHRPIKKHVYLSEHAAYYHEQSCFYNPKNKTCFTCVWNKGNSKSENGCKINKNEHEEYCKKHGWDFNRHPVTKQIQTQCEYWEVEIVD